MQNETTKAKSGLSNERVSEMTLVPLEIVKEVETKQSIIAGDKRV